MKVMLFTTRTSELGIFGEESVPGMQRVTPGAARRLHQLVNAKIAFARGSRADRVRFIGQSNVQRRAVRGAENGGGNDAHFAASPCDPHGDFPAIGDEDFLEHEIKFWLAAHSSTALEHIE